MDLYNNPFIIIISLLHIFRDVSRRDYQQNSFFETQAVGQSSKTHPETYLRGYSVIEKQIHKINHLVKWS